jgi:hypothetical protein
MDKEVRYMEYFKAQQSSNQEPKLEIHGDVPPTTHMFSCCRPFQNSQAECSGV